MIFGRHLFLAIIFGGLVATGAFAQQTTPPDAPSATPQQNPDPAKSPAGKDAEVKEQKVEQQSGTSNDRLFYTLPNFLTVETKNLPPLTTGQKFKVVARGSFDYNQIPWYAFLASIGQAQDSESGYGQGAQGYFKRFGANFADGTIDEPGRNPT